MRERPVSDQRNEGMEQMRHLTRRGGWGFEAEKMRAIQPCFVLG